MTKKPLSTVDDHLESMAAHARLEQALSRRLRREGVGLSDYRVLRLLSRSPKREMRLLDLTDALGLEQSTVSRLVVRLEQVDCVVRQPCGDDRRGVFCVLTPEGVRRERRLTPIFAAALAEAVS